MSDRRLSQAIAEGDGISILVHVAHEGDARTGETHGAEGIVVRAAGFYGAVGLPVLAYGPDPEEAAALGADAVVVPVDADDEKLVGLVERAAGLGLEWVPRVRDEVDLERVLDQLDPEVILLVADDLEDDQAPLARLLELLPDIPAGKLAIAELEVASRADVDELERAGVDAVLVTGSVAGLVDTPPEV